MIYVQAAEDSDVIVSYSSIPIVEPQDGCYIAEIDDDLAPLFDQPGVKTLREAGQTDDDPPAPIYAVDVAEPAPIAPVEDPRLFYLDYLDMANDSPSEIAVTILTEVVRGMLTS